MQKKTLSYWLPPILWALVIFSFSAFQTRSTSEIYWKDFIVKKTAHVVEYGIFATLLYRAMINSNEKKSRAMFISVLVAFIYGITDEIHQSFTPGRQPTLRDTLIDAFGAWLFVYGFVKNNRFLPAFAKNILKRFEII